MSLGCGKGKVQHAWALLRVGEGQGGNVGVWQGLLHYRDGGRQVEAGEGLLHTLLTSVWLRPSDKCEAALCVCAVRGEGRITLTLTFSLESSVGICLLNDQGGNCPKQQYAACHMLSVLWMQLGFLKCSM